MDISGFLGGQYLTHVDLPAPSQVWTIKDAKAQMVGDDSKICVYFKEHHKPLGLNKTNLNAVAEAYGVVTDHWTGQRLELIKSTTDFQGRTVPCVRVRTPPQANNVPVAAPPVQPIAPMPLTGAVPVAPQATPWDGKSPSS